MTVVATTRRQLLAGLAATCIPPVAHAQDMTLTPEQFGARGDGRSDDTGAFQRLSAAATGKAGVTIALRPGATYRVGRQVRGPDDTTMPETMLSLRNNRDLTIRGNGATIRLNDGLRYGSFDPSTGRRFDTADKGKFTKPAFGVTIGSLILIQGAAGVRISDVTLDGNMDRLNVGGRWGDRGIQLHADGLRLLDVHDVMVSNVTARNNGLDGIYLRGRTRREEGPDDMIRFLRVRCERNGRQGLSVVGGRGITIEESIFADTAQGPVASAPSAGIDIEPNGRDWTTQLRFVRCEFVNNLGVGLLADQGASRGIEAVDCTFWQGFRARDGVTKRSGDAFWLKKPGVRIAGCTVHGTVTNLDPDASIERTSFDDAAHPRYGRSGQGRRYLLDGAGGKFTDCRFTIDGPQSAGLVYASRRSVFRRCYFHVAGSGLQPGRAVMFLGSDAVLDDVRFTEALPPGKEHFFIHNGNPTLRGRVEVQGPRVRWGSRTGRVGILPPSG